MEITPISLEQQQLVIDETERYIALAEAQYDRHFELIPVLFDLQGQAAGMYKVTGLVRSQHALIGGAAPRAKRVIRYNPWVFAKYWDENFTTTVPHEVAHYVTEQVYGLSGRAGKVRPHGPEWRSVMKAFGADDSRTTNFDMTGIPQRTMSTVPYHCGCRQHDLSMRRHNRVVREGASYICRFCNQPLTAI